MKPSFTLFEIVVVVMIVALVYYLSFAFFNKQSFLGRDKNEDFRERMIKEKSSKESILTLVCFKKECILEESGRSLGSFDFNPKVKMLFFTLGRDGLLESNKNNSYYAFKYSQEVNFVYSLYPNNIFDSAIMVNEDESSYTVLGPLIWMKESFDKLDEAKDAMYQRGLRKARLAE